MPDGEDEQWSRISAESELRPDKGLVADVPEALITPVPDEPEVEPIELAEVPLTDVQAEPEPEPQAPPIQIVPFHRGTVEEAGPDVISAAPFDVRPPEAPVEEVPDVEVITDVPTPHPDPVEVVADLPDHEKEPTKTPWWKLMLGGGEARKDRRPTAAEPQPVPEEPSGDDPAPEELSES